VLKLEKLFINQGDFALSANFAVPPDSTTAIIGPSGGGKSTLLLALSGFIKPQGRVWWQGEDISDLPPAKRPVSIMFQAHNLFPHLTLQQNVGLGLRTDFKLSKPERLTVEAALARVGLAGRGADYPRALSGGQMQRAALARTILRKKPLLLLDEPFAALGPGLRQDMLKLVESLRAELGATLLLVTHAPEDARHIAENVVYVDEEKARSPVETGAFFRKPSPALAAYLGSSPML